MSTMISKTAQVLAWGSGNGARRVSHLTQQERAHVRSGGVVLVQGCPVVQGCTERRVVERNGRFYTRMPG